MFDKARLLQFLNLTHDEAELRHLICAMIGCSAPTPSAAGSGSSPSGAPSVTIKGSITGDAFLFHANLGVPASQNPSQDVQFQLDTGAFEMLLTKAVADTLKLPNEGPIAISGVTGNSPAYKSHVSLAIPGGDPSQGWTSVACVVDPSFTGVPLFGLRFFIDHKQELTLNPVAQTVTLKTVS